MQVGIWNNDLFNLKQPCGCFCFWVLINIKDYIENIKYAMHPNRRSSYTIIIDDEDNITRWNADNISDESLENTSVKHYKNLNNSDENDIIIKKASICNGYQVRI